MIFFKQLTQFIRSKLSYKFSAIVFLIISMLGTFLFVSIEYIVKKTLFQQNEHKAVAIASTLAHQVVDPLLTRNLAQIQLHLKNAQASDEDIIYLFVSDPHNSVPAHTFNGGFPTDLKKLSSTVNYRTPTSQLLDTERGVILNVSVPIMDSKLGHVHIGLSRGPLMQELAQFRNTFLLISFSACIIAILFAIRFGNNITRPLGALAHGAGMISKGTLDYRIQNTKSLDEIGVVTNAFNSMASALETDTAKRIQVEMSLRKSEELYRSLVENIEMGITYVDKNLTITMANAGQGKIFNKEPGQFIGKKCYQEFEKLEKPCPNCPGLLAMEKGCSQETITQRTRDDGSQFTARINTFPIFDPTLQEYTGFIEVVDDITNQQKMEESLSKIKKLESIGVLAGGIAHDFNNILVAILGNINLALFDKSLQDNTKNCLLEAEKASLRAKDLTQQLLTFSKGGEPVKEVSSLEEIIKDSANFVLSGDNVTCHFNIPELLWLVNVDKGQISQVVQNITLNAKEAMPDGGIIEIKCKNVTSSSDNHPFLKEAERFVKVIIHDNGPGIPLNIMEKVFDPYFSTKSQGSGLGLAITYSIINKHGGHISVESSPGGGSTFVIYLPASNEPSAPVKKLPSSASASASFIAKRILIMDDEKIVIKVTKEMLVQLGHEVVVSTNGYEAIQLYQEALNRNEKIDIVIMDLTIPGSMGGLEALQNVLEIDPGAKVIVSSGYSNDPVMANYMDYGFSAAIEKPFQLQKLAQTINQIMG